MRAAQLPGSIAASRAWLRKVDATLRKRLEHLREEMGDIDGRPQDRLPGDTDPRRRIGPEIVESVVAVLDAMGSPFAWDIQQGGLAAIEAPAIPCPARRWTASAGPGSLSRGR